MLFVKELNKSFVGDKGKMVRGLNDVSFEIPKGKIFTLLGPSGCGKTTTLRCVAGLERPNSGEIRIENRTLYSLQKNIFVAPSERSFGMVFQSYAIWPHMNVFENVAFPLKHGRKKYSREQVQQKVEHALNVVQLYGLASREATKLSGGQQQRLALARAFVMEPDLLLLDEPLSNLDAKLREHMRIELKRLQREVGITTLYVTHDQIEAIALSDQIAVMNNGGIVQIGLPRDIYEFPQNQFVADFIGSTNFLNGKIIEPLQDGLYKAFTEIGELTVHSVDNLAREQEILISVRPEHIQLSLERPSEAGNIFEGIVKFHIFLGEHLNLHLQINEKMIETKIHPSMNIKEGDTVYIKLDPMKCIAIPGYTANEERVEIKS